MKWAALSLILVAGAWAMEVSTAYTVAVTIHTTSGAQFKMSGRVDFQELGAPDTVTVEFWKDGEKKTYRFLPTADSVSVRLWSMPAFSKGSAK